MLNVPHVSYVINKYRSFAGIASSNPAEGTEVRLVCVLCVVNVATSR